MMRMLLPVHQRVSGRVALLRKYYYYRSVVYSVSHDDAYSEFNFWSERQWEGLSARLVLSFSKK
jgi:hypothetical protein